MSSLTFRRTLIPLFLTHGVFLPILGGLWFLTDDDSPFRRLGTGTALALIGVGVTLLLTGILNVLYIKHLRQIKPHVAGT